MAAKTQEVLETISNMTVLEIVELIKAMEDRFGVTAQVAAPVMMAAGGAYCLEKLRRPFWPAIIEL